MRDIKKVLEDIQDGPSADTFDSVVEVQAPEAVGIRSEEPKEVKTKQVNVRLSSKQKDRALNPGVLVIGRCVMTLPSKEEQLAGFYVEDPGVLVGQYDQYKFFQEKGRTVPHTISI